MSVSKRNEHARMLPDDQREPALSRLHSILLLLAGLVLSALLSAAPAAAFEVVTVPEDVNAVNLTAAVDVVRAVLDPRVRG